MPMTGYTKLFNSILASTIWRADDKVRIVWITLLAMADRRGVAEGSVPGLADLARVSIPDCVRALDELSSPDEWSRSQVQDGRRIEAVDGGWLLLNHDKYRSKLSTDERREYKTIKQREYRKRAVDGDVDTNSTGGRNGHIHLQHQHQKQKQLKKERAVATRPKTADNEKPKKPFAVIRALAHDVLSSQGPFEEDGDFIEALKAACAQKRIPYDSQTVRKAVDALMVRHAED